MRLCSTQYCDNQQHLGDLKKPLNCLNNKNTIFNSRQP